MSNVTREPSFSHYLHNDRCQTKPQSISKFQPKPSRGLGRSFYPLFRGLCMDKKAVDVQQPGPKEVEQVPFSVLNEEEEEEHPPDSMESSGSAETEPEAWSVATTCYGSGSVSDDWDMYTDSSSDLIELNLLTGRCSPSSRQESCNTSPVYAQGESCTGQSFVTTEESSSWAVSDEGVRKSAKKQAQQAVGMGG